MEWMFSTGSKVNRAVRVAGTMALLSALVTTPALAEKVVAITDGDTVEALIDGKAQKVRLAQIDAPEKQQPYGSVAKTHLSKLAFGKDCTIEQVDKDRYGRIVGQIHCEGVDVNLQMVTDGLAWAYTKYVTDDAYHAAQKAAMATKRGLWQESAPIAPWEWRKLKKQ